MYSARITVEDAPALEREQNQPDQRRHVRHEHAPEGDVTSKRDGRKPGGGRKQREEHPLHIWLLHRLAAVSLHSDPEVIDGVVAGECPRDGPIRVGRAVVLQGDRAFDRSDDQQ